MTGLRNKIYPLIHAEYKYRSDEITITQHAYILLYRKIQVNEYAETYMPVQQQKWKILY